MKIKMLEIMSAFCIAVAVTVVQPASLFIWHQPKLPKSLIK